MGRSSLQLKPWEYKQILTIFEIPSYFYSCDYDTMINNIKDCKVVISYGMGRRIYTDLIKNDIQPVVTEEKSVNEAVNKYIKKELKNRPDKLH